MTLTAKVRDVRATVSVTAARACSASILYNATVPRAPASLTAAASAGLAMPPIPACTRGKSTANAPAAAAYGSAIRHLRQGACGGAVGVREGMDPAFETEGGTTAVRRLPRIADVQPLPEEVAMPVDRGDSRTVRS